nr:EOG090X0FII [Ilyocryptus agilis]
MADCKSDSDGFITVSKRKSSKNKSRTLPSSTLHLDDTYLDCDACLRTLTKAKEEVGNSRFFTDFITLLSEVLGDRNEPISDIVCLGLGRFSSCRAARYQLAFLLLLYDHFRCPVEVSDPVFSQEEKDFLKRLGLRVATINCEGRRKVTSLQSLCLFILPHCPRELSNNLLYANWDQFSLRNCIIYANSFESVRLNTPRRFLEIFHNLLQVKDVVKEIPVSNTFYLPDVFNDLCLHVFPTDKLQSVQSSFWDSPEPSYPRESELILSQDDGEKPPEGNHT